MGDTSTSACHRSGGGRAPGPRASSRFVFGLCWAWLLSGIVQTLPSSFFPSQAVEFGVGDIWIGTIFSAYQTFMIVATPFAVVLTQKFGALSLVRVALLLLMLANGLMGLTSSLAPSQTGISSPACFIAASVALRGLSGLCACGIMIGGNTCIMQSCGMQDLGYNLAIFETAGSVGLCIGPMLGSYLFALGGYRCAFLGISAVMTSGIFLYERPHEVDVSGGPQVGSAGGAQTDDSASASATEYTAVAAREERESIVDVLATATEDTTNTANACRAEKKNQSRRLSLRSSVAAESRGEARRGRSSGGGGSVSFWTFARSPFLMLLCVDLLVAGVAWTFVDPILERHVRVANGLGQVGTGGLFAMMSVTYILATAVVGLAAGSFHESMWWTYGVMYLGLGGLSTGLFLLSYEDIYLEISGLSFLGIGQALTYLPIVLALTHTLRDRCAGDISPAVAGISQFFVSVGFALGPFVGSDLTWRFSFRWCCLMIAASAVLAATMTAVALGCEMRCVSQMVCNAGKKNKKKASLREVFDEKERNDSDFAYQKLS